MRSRPFASLGSIEPEQDPLRTSHEHHVHVLPTSVNPFRKSLHTPAIASAWAWVAVDHRDTIGATTLDRIAEPIRQAKSRPATYSFSSGRESSISAHVVLRIPIP